MRRLPSLGSLVLLAILIVVLVTAGSDDSGQPQPEPAAVHVTRVVDGDTIEVDYQGHNEDVRYIGVDTPESVKPDTPVQCYALAASHFNERLVEGEDVRLTFDAERRDVYGRLLAYVHLGPTFVNAELVRRGYARTLTISPNTQHASLFDRLERAAADAGRGLWGRCEP
ncbi:MAG: thermonuclease family protein [Solirubrobacterales bacterium]